MKVIVQIIIILMFTGCYTSRENVYPTDRHLTIINDILANPYDRVILKDSISTITCDKHFNFLTSYGTNTNYIDESEKERRMKNISADDYEYDFSIHYLLQDSYQNVHIKLVKQIIYVYKNTNIDPEDEFPLLIFVIKEYTDTKYGRTDHHCLINIYLGFDRESWVDAKYYYESMSDYPDTIIWEED